MEFLIPIIKFIHIAVSIFLIFVVLLQPSKSGDLGSVFGGGTSESLFGASGAVPFLVKLTRLFAVIFVITSLSLGYFSVKSIKSSVIQDTGAVETPEETGGAVEEVPVDEQMLDQEVNEPTIDESTSSESIEQLSDPAESAPEASGEQ